ncbi:MAG: DNA methyltransferase [Cyanobacteria bacterium J06639_18]
MVRSSASALLDPDALKRYYEQELLSLKVVDPACGSGHFLLAAARRIGKELAKIRTGETEPGKEPLAQAIRDVIQNCIYGVDINPLAVDLCKVALWIEGFCSGKPLNFLDHRIKCGNSLVGVLDINCLDEGIPDNAYKPVTGDEKKLATNLKKRNKKERENQGQLSIFEKLSTQRSEYAETWRELGEIPETTPQQVKQKEKQYKETRKNQTWWRDYSACNLWTAAFFMGLTEENLQLLPTTAALSRLVRSSASAHSREAPYEQSIQNIVEAANELAKEKRFFHWCLEFPEVFEEGGFSCVLGNPPWERIKLQEKEFFASRSVEIAKAANKAAREKLIKALPQKNPQLAREWEEAKHDAEAQSKFIRESNRFPLTAVGDINTYAVFTETTRNLISDDGSIGIIIPPGIASDDTTKNFFNDLIVSRNLRKLTSFVNEKFIFKDVLHNFRFCILCVTGSNYKVLEPDFAFECQTFRETEQPERHFTLTLEDLLLLNPNTCTCPVFRGQVDAELTKKIYKRVPVLENEKTGSNPWGISFMRMFDMSNDSGLFKNEPGDTFVPLYEGKMFHQFDHRFGSYETLNNDRAHILPDTSIKNYQNTDYHIKPFYYVSSSEVNNRIAEKWQKEWLIVFRGVTSKALERSAVFTILPKFGISNSCPIIIPTISDACKNSCLIANFCSLIFDFIVRQKIGGANFNFFIVKQLPVLPPESYTQEDIEFISTRVLELVYTAWDMQPFAKDMEYDGEPFIWNNQRRALLRAELDAYYAKIPTNRSRYTPSKAVQLDPAW